MNSNLIDNIKLRFQNKFGESPMIVCSPARLNLIGEHTDYNEGFVLPAAIDKYMIAAISRSDSQMCHVVAIDKDEEFQFEPIDLKPISPNSWRNYILGVVAEIQKSERKVPPFNLIFGGDIPEGAGLSSSAALENSVVYALNTLFDLELTKRQMIDISQRAEHNFAGVQCGIMDQYASMFGIADHALFLDCRTLNCEPIKLDLKPFHLVLINSNVKHNLAENAYNERRKLCEMVARSLKVSALRDASMDDLIDIKDELTEEEFQKAAFVIQENARVLKAIQFLKNEDIKAFGALLFQSHDGLKNQYEVSCDETDFLVAFAKSHKGVIGARMIGGGFGGCTLNLVENSMLESFVNEVKIAYWTAFSKECGVYQVSLSQGTHLIK